MRRYLQGTLDFHCGVYAVLNALSCLYGVDLQTGRAIFQETLLAFSACPDLWARFTRNETDHYWVIGHMLSRWCRQGPLRVRAVLPFPSSFDPWACRENNLATARAYLPEALPAQGAPSLADCLAEAENVWESLRGFLPADSGGTRPSRVALLRFYRFAPGMANPLVSHWTAACAANARAVVLHDASAEPGALHALEKAALLPRPARRPLLRVPPESIVFLTRP